MLSVAVLCVCAVAFGHVSARSDSGNFLDDKWLTGRWDKFRDVSNEPGTWTPSKPFDQALDPAKDPCLKIKCSRHKVCVAEDYKTASCVSQRRVSFKDANLHPSAGSKCKPCPVVHPSPVCGSDGHTYSTKCKLDYQACITGKKITVKCPGMCPCPPQPEQGSAEKKVCSESDLKEVVSRLRDWFRVLHENGNHQRVKIQKPEKNKFDVGASPICKDPLGWMFSRLDTNFDLQLDQSEIKSLYLDRNEPCSDAFFKSCDTHPDKVITSSEWCTGFQRYTGVILESSGDLGSGDSVFTDDDEDSFVLSDQAGMDDEDDEDEDDDDDDDEYLS
ncbi:testican-3 isoform 3-T3 [Anableps anableps]